MPSRPLAADAERVRALSRDVAMSGRLARDLPAYLRHEFTLAETQAHVREQLARRQQRLLAVVDRTIYDRPDSPYWQLLKHAGCERGDFSKLVRAEGVEGALRVLATQGVYVTFDEFKGRRVAVRGSARFTFTDRDFDNPCVPWHYFEMTGGTRGRSIRVGRTLPYVTENVDFMGPVYAAHDVWNPHLVFWFGSSPTSALMHLKLGHTLDGWFHPVRPLPLVARAGIQYVRMLARIAGRRIPNPRYLDLQAPEQMVHRIVALRRDGRTVLVNSAVNSAVRVAARATAMGVSLEGVVFHARSEPLTEARQQTIERSGARTIGDYASVELSVLGYSCARRTASDDVHFGTHRYAVIERTRPIFQDGPQIDSLHFTTLSPNHTKIALNVEMGDAGRIEERACGCPLGDLGLTTHISALRSFEKLSTEGTTFARGNLLRILEEILPARFGGSAVDYQLVEEEGPDGTARLVMRIDPAVGPVDEPAVRAAFLDGLTSGGIVETYQARLLDRARVLVVQRRRPIATGAGKVLPFHLNRPVRGTTTSPTPAS